MKFLWLNCSVWFNCETPLHSLCDVKMVTNRMSHHHHQFSHDGAQLITRSCLCNYWCSYFAFFLLHFCWSILLLVTVCHYYIAATAWNVKYQFCFVISFLLRHRLPLHGLSQLSVTCTNFFYFISYTFFTLRYHCFSFYFLFLFILYSVSSLLSMYWFRWWVLKSKNVWNKTCSEVKT